jgi:hypothetical protein
MAIRCLFSKGWVQRSPKTPTSAEHPGTAVRWEELFFEVVAIEPSAPAGLRYLLSPWDEQHVFRVVANYDEASEKARAEERRESNRRQRNWRNTLVLAPLTGLLPGSVQEAMEREFGASGPLLTLISIVLPFFFGAFCFVWLLIVAFAGASGADATSRMDRLFSIPVLLFGCGLLLESIVRLVVSVAQQKPIGSVLGIVPYALYSAVRSLRHGGIRIDEKRLEPEPLHAAPDRDAREREREDLYRAMHAVLSFLSPDEQMHLVERFGFDPARSGRLTAGVLLAGGGVLFLNSLLAIVGGIAGLGSLITLALGGFLLVEQVSRLRKIAQGMPAPSVLGRLVRPWVHPLFETEPAPDEPPKS